MAFLFETIRNCESNFIVNNQKMSAMEAEEYFKDYLSYYPEAKTKHKEKVNVNHLSLTEAVKILSIDFKNDKSWRQYKP